MDRDYLGTASAQVSQTRELDRIGMMAGNVENITSKLESLLFRMTGSGSDQPVEKTRPMPIGYLSELNRLADAVNKADELVNRLSDIA